jgi:ribose-phosphate pyrophosphokinase
VTAKTRARLLSAIPSAKDGNHVIMIDLHSEGIPFYFEGDITTKHLYAKEFVKKAARDLAKELNYNDFILASTDAGRAKWVESLANDMDVGGAFVLKRRISGSDTQVTAINADVNGKLVIIYDDMIRTGGSLINAAQAYKDAGASDIAVISTHGLLPHGSIEKIQNSGLFKKVIVTNTHPNAVKLESDFLKVISIADIIRNELVLK